MKRTQSHEGTKKHEERTKGIFDIFFLRVSFVTLCVFVALLFVIARSASAQPIDRRALVQRHNITVTSFDPLSPLSVGNGEFAFTVDPTGLQTFPELYSANNQTPLCTMAQWGWHTIPMPENLKGQQYQLTPFDTHGRSVGYQTTQGGPLATWMRENPHKLNLGRIGLEFRKTDGSSAKAGDLKNVKQSLDLWSGVITSEFEFDGKPVKVETCCAGDLDAIGVRITSALLSEGRLGVTIAFPYASPTTVSADWNHPESHKTTITARSEHQIELQRTLDQDNYYTSVQWNGNAQFTENSPHHFSLRSQNPTLEFACAFASRPNEFKQSLTPEAFEFSRLLWKEFWSTGGAIDLSGSTDPRWMELERRIVLSQYLTRINCAGSLPPAETGLTYNSWYGKFHLEMHWWHDVHFALWGHQDLFEKSMDYYRRIFPAARAIAQQQKYTGVRWPKMTDPSGKDSPSGIGPLLLWQQPHPMYYAELCYRAHSDRKTLEQWQQIVEESANFMASFAVLDPRTGKYVLGPPLKTVPEHNDAATTRNPTFELSYWRFGLRIAQTWRERLGLARNADWDRILNNLSPLPTKDGMYLMQEGQDDLWTNWNWEHPSMVGALGMLPGDGVDPKIMRPTLEKVMQTWQWDRCWGWDFPMAAMCAARVGRPDLAIDALMVNSVKNRWLPNGHVYQRDNLTLYLPANGGLLSAVAMMAAGWEGEPRIDAPGFPKEGWKVKYEGLQRMP